MVPNGSDRDGDWWRWRGGKDQEVAQHEEELRKFWDWKAQTEASTARWRETVSARFSVIETKLAAFAALGAVAGGLLATFIQHLFK